MIDDRVKTRTTVTPSKAGARNGLHGGSIPRLPRTAGIAAARNLRNLEIGSRKRALEIFRVEKCPARGGIMISKGVVAFFPDDGSSDRLHFLDGDTMRHRVPME